MLYDILNREYIANRMPENYIRFPAQDHFTQDKMYYFYTV